MESSVSIGNIGENPTIIFVFRIPLVILRVFYYNMVIDEQ